MERALGLQRIKLQEVQPDITNALIVGIIIAKQRPRVIVSSGFSIDGENVDRAVWNFTLRDSVMFFINVSCWGTKNGITELDNKFTVGDVVDIHRPQIDIRKFTDYGEKFRPNVTSPYYLTLSDFPELNIFKHEGCNNAYYNLLHLPTKPIAGAYTIADIHNKKDKLEGVDVFGVLRQIGIVRIITIQSIEKEVREIVIMDKTHPGLKITIWDPHLILRAGSWKLFTTTLLITNLRCEWSAYSRSMVANLTTATIVTEDPALPETDAIRNYAKEASKQFIESLDFPSVVLPNPASIQKVMNIKQILNKIELAVTSTKASLEEYQFYALVYAVVTHLDLDGFSRCIVTKCSRCGTLIKPYLTTCSNMNCQVGLGNGFNVVNNFDMHVILSDHTGSLLRCCLSGQIAEEVLNCDVQKFMALNDEQKSLLKWKLLMERCAVRLHVVCTGYRNPSITIVSCELADPYEVSNKLPHY